MSLTIHAPRWGRQTHSQRLETWLGKPAVEAVSRAMRDWYGPPIAVHGVPGRVYAQRGGGFTGEITRGQHASALDRAWELLGIMRRQALAHNARTRYQLGAYASLSALIAAATGGKAQNLFFNKVGVASNAIGNCVDLWSVGNQPAAGAAGAAAPGGTIPTSATLGALGWVNPSSANTGHFVTGYLTGSVVANTLLLYDRLFAVAKTMNSIAIEAVSGVPTRYQNTSTGNDDYVGGNFVFPSVPTTVLAGTAHNWVAGAVTSPNQGMTYFNQANVESSMALNTGVSACVKNGVDLAAGQWYMTLGAGDVGIKKLETMQASALVATGTVDFVIGHPIAFMPCPVANMICPMDGLYTAFNLTKIFDNAALALLEMPKPATTATTYSGQVTAVSE